jgi:hypothetical protein
MKIEVDSFRGEVPRLTPRALPANAAQAAVNAKLSSGDLEAWRQFLAIKTLTAASPVQTIYLLNDRWLSWTQQVDVARGIVPGDNTFRVFLTCPALYSKPRWTDYALATTGAEPYPVATRPLGVPAPDTAPTAKPGAATTPSVSIIDEGNQLETSWTVSGAVAVGAQVTEVVQDPGVGNAAPSYRLRSRNNADSAAYAYRDCGVADSVVVSFGCDFKLNANGGASSKAGWRIGVSAGGAGACVYVGYPYAPPTAYLVIGTAPDWNSDGSLLAAEPVALVDNGSKWYRIEITLTKSRSGSVKVEAAIFDGTTEIFATEAALSTATGGFCGLQQIAQQGTDPEVTTHYDNLAITGSGTTNADVQTATSYVYRFVNDIGQYGAPSPASETVSRSDGVAVTVTTPTTTPSGTDSAYNVTLKQIFRSITGASGTAYFLVDEIPLAQASFVDELDDNQVADNEVLDSEEWGLPPDDLEGIIALPNQMLAGFRRNQLCLSVSGFPHAWRVRDRKTTDTDIVAIANIDNTIVIGTKSFVYTATGNSNDSYAMSMPGAKQACLSKRGMVFLDGVGVVFPSPDGWVACAGSAGSVPVITGTVFSKQQWEALGPGTIKAAVHDGALYWFSTGQTPDSGYALDTRANGFGLVSLSFHASAAFVDPLSDSLYLVLDGLNEPTDLLLPVASSAPALASPARVIFKFDGATNGGKLRYRWRGKLHLPPYPATLTIAEIKALEFANIVVRIYGDGALLLAKALSSGREFTIPALRTSSSYEIELIGTSTTRTAQVAEDVSELT